MGLIHTTGEFKLTVLETSHQAWHHGFSHVIEKNDEIFVACTDKHSAQTIYELFCKQPEKVIVELAGELDPVEIGEALAMVANRYKFETLAFWSKLSKLNRDKLGVFNPNLGVAEKASGTLIVPIAQVDTGIAQDISEEDVKFCSELFNQESFNVELFWNSVSGENKDKLKTLARKRK